MMMIQPPQFYARSPALWSTYLSDCLSDPQSCCLTLWCPCIAFGQIAEIVDQGSTSCCASGVLYTLIALLTGCPCIYSSCYRIKMRWQYNLDGTCCRDCLIHCFCECCALCQEYRQLQSQGFDVMLGWHGNITRRSREVVMVSVGQLAPVVVAPVVVQDMSRDRWQQNTPSPAYHVASMNPELSPSSAFASRPPAYSPNPPPPPPPLTGSSGGYGSNYSGGDAPVPPPPPGYTLGFSNSIFTYEELALATEEFSDSNLLGQGGFGYVHKGILPNGREVAVKQLKAGSGQGEREFQAEVEIISRVHHRHLVSLVGYCMTGSERLLVYEFVPNNTMEFHLHGKGRPTMDWPTRLKIALGSAKGLAYLHEDCHPKIIHRDIKAANILLDFNFEAKVADFGLAKLFSDLDTHVSTRVMGTFGYLAPEYASSGKLTDKSDVFSFGIMLLELITGRRPVDASQTYMEDSLVDWARPVLTRALEERNFDGLVDPKLQNSYDPNEMVRMVACAAACVRHSARRRPRMSQVVRALEGDVSLPDLNEGIRPGESHVYSSHGGSDYDTRQYKEDIKKFRKMALGSQEDGASSEYSAPTSEYGLYPVDRGKRVA